MSARSFSTSLIQCIEYDWAVVVRCKVCGHTTRWCADALVERFRDSLRASVRDLAERISAHCGERPAVYTVNGAGMLREDRGGFRALVGVDKSPVADPWQFRDLRLRAFLLKHGLPSELADERKVVADADRRRN